VARMVVIGRTGRGSKASVSFVLGDVDLRPGWYAEGGS